MKICSSFIEKTVICYLGSEAMPLDPNVPPVNLSNNDGDSIMPDIAVSNSDTITAGMADNYE